MRLRKGRINGYGSLIVQNGFFQSSLNLQHNSQGMLRVWQLRSYSHNPAKTVLSAVEFSGLFQPRSQVITGLNVQLFNVV